MKKTFLLSSLFVATLFSTTANAQFFRARELPKNDVSLSAGFGVSTAYDDHFESCPTINNSNVADGTFCTENPYLTFNGMYFRNISSRLGVGLQFGCSLDAAMVNADEEYSSLGSDHYFSNGYSYVHEDRASREIVNKKEAVIYIMPAARWYIFNHAHWGAYCRLAVGVGLHIVKEKDLNPHDDLDFNCGNDTSAKLAHQASIGMEWGGEIVRPFVEVGHGNQGIATCGVKVIFGK
ncbi:MAG: hypothetical protein E7070_09525 [Bacteroidales bacterium]|nr:hypothetical protein [Bacteroidales bacterium]